MHGILLDKQTGARTLPLMELEERFRGVGGKPTLQWRVQNKMAKDVSERKVLLYATFRRMDDADSSIATGPGWRGFAAACMEEKKLMAVQQLEEMAVSLYKGRDKSATGGSRFSLDQLCTALRRAPANEEYRPSAYEETILGWGKNPTVQLQTPAHRHEPLESREPAGRSCALCMINASKSSLRAMSTWAYYCHIVGR